MATPPSTPRAFFPIGFGLEVPKPIVINPGNYVFVGAGSFEVSLSEYLMQIGEEDFCARSVYIDNNPGAPGATFILHPLNQRITSQTPRQGWYPCMGVPGILDYTLTATGANTVRMLITNAIIPPSNWAPT